MTLANGEDLSGKLVMSGHALSQDGAVYYLLGLPTNGLAARGLAPQDLCFVFLPTGAELAQSVSFGEDGTVARKGAADAAIFVPEGEYPAFVYTGDEPLPGPDAEETTVQGITIYQY